MKILQLRSTRPPRFQIELHPQLTVLRGISEPLRLELVDTFTSIAAGRPVSMFGLLEAHGILLDLDGTALRVVLGLGGETLSPVLRGSDLPVPEPGASAGPELPAAVAARRLLAQTVAAAKTEVEQAEHRRDDLAARARRLLVKLAESPTSNVEQALRRQEADENIARAEHDLRAADAMRAEVLEMVDDRGADLEAAGRLAAARTRHARAAGALARTVAALEGARSGIEPGVMEAIRRSMTHEAALQGEHDADPIVRAWSEPATPQRGVRSSGEGGETQPDRTEVSPEQRNAVREALRAAEAVAASIPSAEALRLAERWTRASAQQSAAGGGESWSDEEGPSSDDVAAARLRVARAAEVVAALSADRTSFDLDEEAVAEVKAAHAVLLEAQERSGKLFKVGRGKRVGRKVEQAAEVERQLLDGLGFASYAEFAISASGRIRAGSDGRMETARVNLAQARQELADLTARVVGHAPPASTESSALARLRIEATELLSFDPGPDVGQALRNPPPERIPEFLHLMAELDAVGVSSGEDTLDMAGWCDLARRWLDGPAGDTRDRSGSGRRRGVTVQRGRQKDPDQSNQRASDRAHRLRELGTEIAALHVRAVVHGDAVCRTADLELALVSNKVHERTAAEAVRVLEFEQSERAAALLTAGEAAKTALLEGRRRLDEARAFRASLGEPSDPEAIGAELIETQRQLMTAAADVARLEARLQPLLIDLAEIDRQIAADPTPEPTPEPTEQIRRSRTRNDNASRLEEIEWYLLARLAGQRSEAIAGAIPLLLVDPFSEIPAGLVRPLLDWLERMAAAVQVVILSDDPEAAAWVSRLSPERGALVNAPPEET